VIRIGVMIIGAVQLIVILLQMRLGSYLLLLFGVATAALGGIVFAGLNCPWGATACFVLVIIGEWDIGRKLKHSTGE
jgi:hypothetical protein